MKRVRPGYYSPVTRRGTIAILFVAALLAAIPATATGRGAVASRAGCPGQGNASAPTAAQERTMLCLVNNARHARGLAPLATPTSLTRAADRKSGDVIRCDEFSHEACGREFTYWMNHFGYHGCLEGENLAWGSGPYATPLSIFQMWMHSQGHRENILGPYEDTGIGLRVGTLEGNSGAHVWTEEFGKRSC
jgi:uncharacterized protein YkwD